VGVCHLNSSAANAATNNAIDTLSTGTCSLEAHPHHLFPDPPGQSSHVWLAHCALMMHPAQMRQAANALLGERQTKDVTVPGLIPGLGRGNPHQPPEQPSVPAALPNQ